MAILLLADGTERKVQPHNGIHFKLHELYELLDVQMIEIVHLWDGRIMVCDEGARLVSEEYQVTNETASRLFQKGRRFGACEILNHYDEIIGNVLVCKDSEVR